MIPHLATDPFDWTALHALILRAFAGMDGVIDPPSSLSRMPPDALAAEARTGEVWVIGTPARACVILTPQNGALHLHKLAVDPAHHRQGLARTLIALAETRARAMGLPALTLMTRIELTANHATFRALGFVRTGQFAHPGFDRPTALHFRKDL